VAEACFAKALREMERITDPHLKANLLARAEAERVGLAENQDEFRGRTEKALSLEPQADDPWTLSILAWVARRMGLHEQSTGQWERARHFWEQAGRIAERVPTPGPSGQFGWAREKEVGLWADARQAGAFGAMDYADALLGLGDHEGAGRWLERAERLLEGPDHGLSLLARAKVLFKRADSMGDSLTIEADRDALFERTLILADAAKSEEGTWLAGMAEYRLGQSSAIAGDHARAVERFEAVLNRIQDVDEARFRFATIETLMLLADSRAAAEELEPAAEAWRRALRIARGAAESESRDTTVRIIHKLHGNAIQRKALDEGRELMQALSSLQPAISAGAHRMATLIEPQMMGAQLLAESRFVEADAAFARGESLARDEEGPAGGYWERQSAFQRGVIALEQKRQEEAREHLNRALSVRVTALSAAHESAERAEILLRLALSEISSERFEAVERLLTRTSEEGVASGRADGRFYAAVASWHNAGLPQHEIEDRRRLLDAAARLGRLSGVVKGRELAAKAEEALKELS